MKKKNPTIEHEGCIERLPKIDRQLHPLITLETATKKRRALKRATSNSVLVKLNASARREGKKEHTSIPSS
jgi:hypothetical protein